MQKQPFNCAEFNRRAKLTAHSLIGLYGITSADAEDIYLEFVRVIEHAHYDPAKGSYATFVNTILRRRRANVLRRFKRYEAHVRRREFEDITTFEPGAALDAAVLGQALATLSTRDRCILRLLYWENLSQQEVAHRLSLPRTTLQRRLAQILAELHRRLC